MSQWDFGYGREPSEDPEPRAHEWSYPYPDEQQQYRYPDPAQFPQYPPAQLPDDGPRYSPPGVSYSTGLPYDVRRPVDLGHPADVGWPGTADDQVDPFPGDTYPGAVYPADEVYDPPPEYPITYERDGFEGRFAPPAAPAPDADSPYPPWPPAAAPADEFEANRFGPGNVEPEPPAGRWRPPPPPGQRWETSDRDRAWQPGREPRYPGDPDYRGDPAYLGPGPRIQTGRGRHQAERPSPDHDDDPWYARRPDRRRWLVPAVVAVGGAAIGVAIVVFAFGQSHGTPGTTAPGTRSSAGVTGAGSPAGVASPGSGAGASAAGSASAGASASAAGSAPGGAAAGSSGAGSAPLSLAAARSVLAGYTAANNNANARRDATTLATIETAGSFAIDSGLYTVEAAEKSAPFPAFAPASATYYIPQAEPAGGTRWFVVQVANAFSSDPKKVTSTEYLLFTQAPSGAWQNAIEPYLLTGADAPQISVGGNGLATAVSPTATSLALAPGQLAQRTAASLDNAGAGAGAGVAASDPSALADRSDQAFWRAKLPTATVTDTHAAATGPAGQTFALRTADGGALVFYTDAATLTITAPPGSTIRLKVPGLYSPSQPLSQAGLTYLDQFAALDPPPGAGPPTVIAQYSGLTGKA